MPTPLCCFFASTVSRLAVTASPDLFSDSILGFKGQSSRQVRNTQFGPSGEILAGDGLLIVVSGSYEVLLCQV